MASEDRRGASHSENWGREAEVSESGKQQIKGPKVRVCVQCLRKSRRKPVWPESSERGTQWKETKSERQMSE